jgi:hypothetical protein
VCISWTIKYLISLMHGVTMKSYWRDMLHTIDMFRYRKKSDRGEGTVLLDDLHALWCASPLCIIKYLSKWRSVNVTVIRDRTKFNTFQVYTRFPLVLQVSTWFNPKGLTPWICYTLRQINKSSLLHFQESLIRNIRIFFFN